jgi:hypothetical protein
VLSRLVPLVFAFVLALRVLARSSVLLLRVAMARSPSKQTGFDQAPFAASPAPASSMFGHRRDAANEVPSVRAIVRSSGRAYIAPHTSRAPLLRRFYRVDAPDLKQAQSCRRYALSRCRHWHARVARLCALIDRTLTW